MEGPYKPAGCFVQLFDSPAPATPPASPLLPVR